MIWAAIVAGFTIGILGSLHCVGMCGPLALSIPFQSDNKALKWIGVLSYNFGRIISYAFLGLLLGFVGSKITLFGWQQTLSLILGVLLLLGALAAFFRKRFLRVPILHKLWNKAFSKTFGKLMKKKTIGAFLVLGILNGFLPCGLVYVAITGALATGDLWSSTLFMAAFGFATLPSMVTVSYLGTLLKTNLQRLFFKLSPIVIGLMAILLILRGSGLNIPYLSPKMMADEKVECCSPSDKNPDHDH